jgi:hypothetical protein
MNPLKQVFHRKTLGHRPIFLDVAEETKLRAP